MADHGGYAFVGYLWDLSTGPSCWNGCTDPESGSNEWDAPMLRMDYPRPGCGTNSLSDGLVWKPCPGGSESIVGMGGRMNPHP